MRHGVVLNVRAVATIAALLLAQPGAAHAHAFAERYDLPAPLGYFIAGAAATVALSFVVAALFMRRGAGEVQRAGIAVPLGPLLLILRAVCRVASVAILVLVIVAGLYGTRNPEMNIAPVLVWIIWWVGFSLLVACCGNLWPAVDPWRTLYDWADAIARRCGRAQGASFGLDYPARLGAWPAVFLLLAYVWIEVLYPRAAVPSQLAWIVLAWSAATLLGMIAFGARAWQRNADVFAIYFSTLGRFAPIAAGADGRSIVLRMPGHGLMESAVASTAMVAFVIAMLATVLFDGLLGTQLIGLARHLLAMRLPHSPELVGYFLGTTGLVLIWLVFLGAYLLACRIMAALAPGRSTAECSRLFALTLVPIAIAYSVAHYFSYLAVQGQLIIRLVSDPLGRKWDLFGTASYYPDISILDARITWYMAIASIVTGHVISIWLAHRVALREFGGRARAVAASVPLTGLMVLYTAVSLLVIAEPLVQFGVASK